ncbi:DoxX family protein [uncultured Oxalicibacterium sp.]|uniref:DoxX family protein n=1 Tax=uncultured Oxalicibacterium sp. TaxID=1168540 RepID=UPI0025E0B81B|nr:DoxX family protein [uncultured Oxalicibacterium sp.]
MNSWHFLHAKALNKIHDLGLLGLRIWVAQEFLFAGYTKLSDGIAAPEWFSSLSFPFPLQFLSADMNWIAAGVGEVLFGLVLLLGLYSRLAALGLMYITFVAVYTVHFDLGWAGWNQIDTDAGQGFKVPLMLALMLFAVLTQGGGRFSIDGIRRPS